VKGELRQEGKVFHFPVELLAETNTGKEVYKCWVKDTLTNFQIITSEKPVKILVDPDYYVPTIRWMPPQLKMIWDFYPDITVVYGTLEDEKENKKAAERFVDEFAGLNHKIIKPDTVLNKEDMKAKCLILIGRPETNQVSKHFKDYFPVKFTGNRFNWNGTNYIQPSQGVAQIIENPEENRSLIILFAGLSGETTLNIFDKNEWQESLDENFLIDYDASYIIFDKHQKITAGDWKNTKSDMVLYP